ncbi:MAG: sugar ABC transporter permease [Anaerolineae bacterium]|nr:sugar ABC transporter permease [Anaerolineae bacterium]
MTTSNPTIRREVPVRREISLRMREALHGYAFILIWVVGFALFAAIPLYETFQYSLNQVSVTTGSIELSFVEWANYSRAILTDPNFIELLIGYTIETLVSVPIVLIFAMVGIGLRINLGKLLRTGSQALVFGIAVWAVQIAVVITIVWLSGALFS